MVGADTFLVTDYGKAYTAKGLGKKMREWCDAAGVPPMVDAAGRSKNVASHGLRKLCLTRLAEAGCAVIEMQGISAQRPEGIASSTSTPQTARKRRPRQ